MDAQYGFACAALDQVRDVFRHVYPLCARVTWKRPKRQGRIREAVDLCQFISCLADSVSHSGPFLGVHFPFSDCVVALTSGAMRLQG
jgi:hypothetical protein